MYINKRLQDFGLDEQEAAIYTALLKRGGSSASIIARDVGIKRTSIYDMLTGLARKGFVKIIYKNHSQSYIPVKPENIAFSLQKKAEAFHELIPKLLSVSNDTKDVFGVQVIESLDQLKEFYIRCLRTFKGQKYDIIGNTNTWADYDKEFIDEYRVLRAKAGIQTRLLLTEDSKLVNPTNNKELKRKVQYLPENITFNSILDIFPDRILIISPEENQLAIVVRSPVMIGIFQSMFQSLWECYKK